MEGFQLWLNLPAKDKMCAPWYRDIPAAQIPEVHTPQGVAVRVIAGTSHGVTGAMQREITLPLYLDLALPAGAVFEQPLPDSHNAFVYVYRGELAIAGQTLAQQRLAILANAPGSDGVRLRGGPLITARPLGEPVVQYGPFVMNSQQQIMQAVEDFRAGRLA